MAYITAAQMRTKVTTPLTQDELELKYQIAQLKIQEEAGYGRYWIDVIIGSAEVVEFDTFLTAQGFRVVAAPTDAVGVQVRSTIVGDATTLRVSWQNYTVVPSVTTAAAGDTVTFAITTVGVGQATLYWGNIGTLTASDFTDNLDEGVVNLAVNGSATITRTLKTPLTQAGTILFKLYSDVARLDTLAEANQVSVSA